LKKGKTKNKDNSFTSSALRDFGEKVTGNSFEE